MKWKLVKLLRFVSLSSLLVVNAAPVGQPSSTSSNTTTSPTIPVVQKPSDVDSPPKIKSTGGTTKSARSPEPNPPGMVWIPGGVFTMGTDSDLAFPNERPSHRVRVDAFWMDEHEVTNAEFQKFVDATRYVTVAERAPTAEEILKQSPPGTPTPPKEMLVPGSLVFNNTEGPVPVRGAPVWWSWVPGANWKHPEGPDSSIIGRENHPVVQVCWDDAVAYAKWAGKRLPTEAEWEFAARGGLEGKRFCWGDESPTDKAPLCNIWQGDFPYRNTKSDGFERTAPVKSFKPNGYGLYDMPGNVWEWCSDWYRSDMHASLAGSALLVNPSGPAESFDSHEPYTIKRVMKGGSFLCHITYCESYRPSARRGNAPDTGMSHVGIRCVMPARSGQTRTNSGKGQSSESENGKGK